MDKNFRNIILTILGACIGIGTMSALRNGASAAMQCENLSRGSQIELPSGRIMTCQ